MTKNLTSLAFFLPQFHEIPENNTWWGPGFTEWTQLRRAKPWTRGQTIRRPIAPLGEYCLTDPETLEKHWDLASRYGIDGFAVWDYWFGEGKRLLDAPIDLVLKSKLHFKYCLAWANHSWSDKSNNRMLCEQKYPGPEDYKRHFLHLLPHFASDNYIKIEGKPVFFIYNPHEVPNLPSFIDHWRQMAQDHGFPDVFLIADRVWELDPVIKRLDMYSDGFRFMSRRNSLIVNYLKEKALNTPIKFGPRRFDFNRLMKDQIPANATDKFAPTVFTGWDTTPRHGRRGVIFHDIDIATFENQLKASEAQFAKFPESQHVLFLKSWNEWAEGNIMEPDTRFGSGMLEAFARHLKHC